MLCGDDVGETRRCTCTLMYSRYSLPVFNAPVGAPACGWGLFLCTLKTFFSSFRTIVGEISNDPRGPALAVKQPRKGNNITWPKQ